METVHYLNLEYILLRVYEVFYNSSVVTTVGTGVAAPVSSVVHTIAIFLGNTALAGMFLTLIIFIFLVWVRVRIVVVEHSGFEEKELQHHLHEAAGVARGPQPGQPKNPRWSRVHELANASNESDWRLAILEADIMLGDLLKEQGYRGEAIGDRLRDVNPLQFSTLDLAWQAHKVRNDIAHAGTDFHLSQREANATIDLYRRVFEEFSYI